MESKPLILIIDDEPNVGGALVDYLELKGFKAMSVLNGRQGLEIILHERPRVVVLDVMMPDMNGLEVLKKIKSEFPETIVLMLTGVYDEKTAREAIKNGAYDYLTKPIDFNDFIALIQRILV